MTECLNTISKTVKDDDILFIYTKKIPAIKSLIEALKEIFRDVSLKFSPKVVKIDENGVEKVTGGMYITALNSNSNILVRLHLEADKFGYYKCTPNPEDQKNYIMLGVNMSNLFKLIKFLNNDDELYMIYNKNSLNQLNLRYENKPKKRVSDYYLNLLDLKEDNIVIGKQKFDFVIAMPSADFHGLIKNMSVIAELVDITFGRIDSNNYSLIFKCEGEFASQISAFNTSSTPVTGCEQDPNNSDTQNVINVYKCEDGIEEKDNNIVQGIYELKALSLFSRCSQMCPIIELYIRNDSPLVIKYRVADMGSVHLILSPINNNDEINGVSDEESSDDDHDQEDKEC
jgi:proliferating cell nuclear antigen